MNRFLVWLLLIAAAVEIDAEILDRIAVTVGKTVITEGEVLRSIRVAAFLDQKEPDLSGPSKRKAAERLVDQILLRREVPVVGANLDSKQLASRYASEADYAAALQKYGIRDVDVQAQLSNALTSIEAANRRFRPEIQVSDEEVRGYYDNLVARWRTQNVSKIPSFEDARDEARTLLLNDRVSDALEQWLQMARQTSGVVYREKVFQ
jgi:hypothetical protein